MKHTGDVVNTIWFGLHHYCTRFELLKACTALKVLTPNVPAATVTTKAKCSHDVTLNWNRLHYNTLFARIFNVVMRMLRGSWKRKKMIIWWMQRKLLWKLSFVEWKNIQWNEIMNTRSVFSYTVIQILFIYCLTNVVLTHQFEILRKTQCARFFVYLTNKQLLSNIFIRSLDVTWFPLFCGQIMTKKRGQKEKSHSKLFVKMRGVWQFPVNRIPVYCDPEHGTMKPLKALYQPESNTGYWCKYWKL